MTKRTCYSKDFFSSEKQALLKIQQAVDNAMDSCLLTDNQGRIVYANHAACKSLGYTQEQMFGMTIADIDPGYTPEMFAQDAAELVKKKTVLFESHHMTQDGHIFPVEISVNYLSEAHEAFLACSFARDISKRKAAQETIEHAKTTLGRRVEERTALLALTAEISANFVAASPVTIREIIEDALHRIGRFFKFDRVAFFPLMPDLVGGDKVLEWCAKGIESKAGILSSHPIIDNSKEKLANFFKKQTLLHFPDVDKIADRLDWKSDLKKLGIESALFLASRTDKKIYGIVGFEMMQPYDRWPEDHINGLKVITQIFAHAVAGVEFGLALIEAKNSLEARVAQRTLELKKQVVEKEKAMKELAESQSSLVKASRAAGMAEVATNVLHNVGNVLNSINTSVASLEGQVKKSRMTNVQKVIEMFPLSKKDLAGFLIEDPKGRLILDYLTSLGQALTAEQKAMHGEIEQLVSQIDHVKQIIAMQQRYGSVHGVKESFAPEQLVEDAIRMNSDSLIKNGIRIERKFDLVPTIVTDKHMVLQILLNLISNAKHACSENKTGQGENCIIISLSREGENQIKIKMKDNGAGIAPENLSLIFHHGFTTRRHGHGFGLHSGALAAKQLGGSLTAESAGLGCGAVFTLRLPLSIQETS
ncbi:ATP-binding protein [uncultured Desulfobacter sp.]|uniref:PAS domain-containing sensor histidine kinase n=1 Tax=uncultured Desulfobacter sp. TaxID=240139 RepID=UPI0029F464CB|nr:ATP-binding protein [uncultured Desulfobacter sp.]